MLLRDLGEWELLRRLAAYAPPGQFEDDAALLQEQAGRTLVVNTDVLVEGLHFSDATMAAADLGWRAAAANLSDLAAMGCRSVVGLTVGLVAPGTTPWPWVDGVYQGLSEALARYGGTLLGGDCSGGEQRLLAVTALGHLGRGPIRRSDGRPGDRLVSTGPHGLSRLGLALLQGELTTESTATLPAAPMATEPRQGSAEPDPALASRAIQAHQRPQPRLDAVAALEACQPPATGWRVGGTDSSDGLLAAVAAIARSSGCQARLARGALPLDAAMATLPQAERWCLSGGEDFELVLALEPAWAEALLRALPGARVIGELRAAAATPDTQAAPVLWQESNEPVGGSEGWCHFQG